MALIKKLLCILFIILFFVILFFININRQTYVEIFDVISASVFIRDNGEIFKLDETDTFDADYTEHNRSLSELLGITEDEAFVLGELGKIFAENLLYGRTLYINKNDIASDRFSYKTKFESSAYCIEQGKPCSKTAFESKLGEIRKGGYVILDTDNEIYYPVNRANARRITNRLVIKKSHIKKSFIDEYDEMLDLIKMKFSNPIFESGNIKIIVSDATVNLKPNMNCSDNICKEFVSCINNSKKTIDMAIYGYLATPAIEKALKDAVKRGVRIRLVYDVDKKNKNIYPDTTKLLSFIKNNNNDGHSATPSSFMHNKFFIFDDKTVLTGSANLSYKDMSGFNSNVVVKINSAGIADIYRREFEQMYNGKFHKSKSKIKDKEFDNISIFFSPNDKPLNNAVIPIIKDSKKYIYMPAFIISDSSLANELIKAKNRGVDVKIIIDAIFASNNYSLHEKLRSAGIPVKIENYAGKMHSKSIISDDKYIITGSMNFSKAGNEKNDENLLVIKDEGAAKFYKKFFLYYWKKIPNKWLKHNPGAESLNSYGSCFDGEDNNYNNLIDLQEPACKPEKTLKW